MGDNGTSLGRSSDGEEPPPAERSTQPPGDGDIVLTPSPGDLDAGTPEEFVEAVADLATEEPSAAGDRIGDLVRIAREDAGLVDRVGDVLDVIGWRRPIEFDVWIDDLVSLAESADDDLSFIGLRAIAQLAGERPEAARPGIGVALNTLGAPPDLRRPALSIVAEIGGVDPDAVRRADRPVAAALGHEDPEVRVVAALAAGRLLGADPAQFPRTARALVDAVDDADDRVHEFVLVALGHFAIEHPTNVPDRKRAIRALTGASDDDLGLARGTTEAALYNLLELELGFDAGD